MKTKKKELVSVELEKKDPQTLYNENVYEHLLACQKIVRPVLENREGVNNAITEYFNACKDFGVKPTLSGMAGVLNLSRKELLDVVNGHKKVENSDIIITAFRLLEQFDEITAKDGKIPPIISIFMMKNNYGYTDGVKVEVVNEELTNEEIAKRYRERHEIVAEVDVEEKKK